MTSILIFQLEMISFLIFHFHSKMTTISFISHSRMVLSSRFSLVKASLPRYSHWYNSVAHVLLVVNPNFPDQFFGNKYHFFHFPYYISSDPYPGFGMLHKSHTQTTKALRPEKMMVGYFPMALRCSCQKENTKEKKSYDLKRGKSEKKSENERRKRVK